MPTCPNCRTSVASSAATFCPRCGAPMKAGDPSPLGRRPAGFVYESKRKLLGWPLVSVAAGFDPATGRKRVAKGWIAVGGVAVGGLAVGGTAFGGICIGGVAVGLIANGGVAIGLLAAAGGLAVGTVAVGGMAVGLLAVGGAAFGGWAYGGGAVGLFTSGGHHAVIRPH